MSPGQGTLECPGPQNSGQCTFLVSWGSHAAPHRWDVLWQPNVLHGVGASPVCGCRGAALGWSRGSLARTVSAAGLCPEPGQRREPELSPPLLGRAARSAACVNRACCFTVGLSHLSPPAPLRDLFPVLPVQRTLWDPISPAAPSPTRSGARCSPQWHPHNGEGMWRCEPGGRMRMEGTGSMGWGQV